MSKIILRPHRGLSSVMQSDHKDMILKNGELFIEIPDTITGDNQYKIKIGNGVDTYENLKYAIDPTNTTTQGINDATTILGAKNLLPNGGTSKTIYGVTFIVNEDGSITANGTSTEQLSFDIFDINYPGFEYIVKNALLGKRLILSGCPEGGGRDSYSINIYRVGSVDGSDITILERGDGVEFTWLNNLSGILPVVEIVVRKNVTLDNITFYPMIRLASIADPTYAPYAMTNKELTDNLLKVCTREVTLPSVSAGQDINIGSIDTLTGGRISGYNFCLGVMLINTIGQLGYDSSATVYLNEDGDVVVTPWVSQNNSKFKIAFLYY